MNEQKLRSLTAGSVFREGCGLGALRERLAYYKVPAHWELRSEPLPRTATGKLVRDVLLGRAQSTFVAE